MEKNLDKIKKLARQKEEKNQEFRLFLKGSNHYQIDKIVHELYQKYLLIYDCKKCANCCKELIPALIQEEKVKIAEYLGMSNKKFKDNYIERKTPVGYVLKGSECPFLDNNECSIYECRPEVCSSYPHLHKENINNRLLSIMDNSHICPIVYNVLEDLKKKLWYKDGLSNLSS